MKFEPTLNISWQEIEEKIFLVDEINDRVYCLEGVSYVIWNAIVVGKDEEQILQHILNIYEIDIDSAQKDKREFIEEMIKLGFLRIDYD